MNGNELYELMRRTYVNCGHTDVRGWDDLAHSIQLIWQDLAAQVTTAVAQADPVYPVTDDEIMSWIEGQKPNVLARLYRILHSMGYRI